MRFGHFDDARREYVIDTPQMCIRDRDVRAASAAVTAAKAAETTTAIARCV